MKNAGKRKEQPPFSEGPKWNIKSGVFLSVEPPGSAEGATMDDGWGYQNYSGQDVRPTTRTDGI